MDTTKLDHVSISYVCQSSIVTMLSRENSLLTNLYITSY